MSLQSDPECESFGFNKSFLFYFLLISQPMFQLSSRTEFPKFPCAATLDPIQLSSLLPVQLISNSMSMLFQISPTVSPAGFLPQIFLMKFNSYLLSLSQSVFPAHSSIFSQSTFQHNRLFPPSNSLCQLITLEKTFVRFEVENCQTANHYHVLANL